MDTSETTTCFLYSLSYFSQKLSSLLSYLCLVLISYPTFRKTHTRTSYIFSLLVDSTKFPVHVRIQFNLGKLLVASTVTSFLTFLICFTFQFYPKKIKTHPHPRMLPHRYCFAHSLFINCQCSPT